MSQAISTTDASIYGWYGAAFISVAIVLVAPIWAVEYPPLVDYPDHLARGYILYHHDEIPTFRAQFTFDLLSTPSLAMDLFMLGLQPIADIRLVGKLFLTLTLLLWLFGWHFLGYAIHGRPTWLALGASLTAYHSMFLYGFTNYSFALGVFLFALAAWYYGRNHWPWPRHLLTALCALACFYSHLSSFIFFAGSVLAVTAWECLQARAFSRAAIVNVLPIFVPLVFVRGGGQSGLDWNFPGKLVGALSLFRGYYQSADIVFMAYLIVLLILFVLWATQRRAVGSVLFTGLGCVGMFLVRPYTLFGGAPADARFLPVAAALTLLSLNFTFPRGKALALLGLFLLLVLFRIGLIAFSWREIDMDLKDQVALFADFPEEARVYPIVHVSTQLDERKRELPSFHAIDYAVIERRVYVPTIMAFKGHVPIAYRNPRLKQHVDPEPFPSADDVRWDDIFAQHDYLWCYRVPDDYQRILEQRCILVAAKGGGAIWRVRKAR